jgi:hypothetical protein
MDPTKKLLTWTPNNDHWRATKDTVGFIPLISSQAYIIKATGIHETMSNKTPNAVFIEISRIEC